MSVSYEVNSDSNSQILVQEEQKALLSVSINDELDMSQVLASEPDQTKQADKLKSQTPKTEIKKDIGQHSKKFLSANELMSTIATQ